MSQQSQTQTKQRQPVRKSTRTAPLPRPVASSTPTILPIDTGRDIYGSIFQVLLGVAACLALVAVLVQSGATEPDPTSVDAPPPAVFTQTD